MGIPYLDKYIEQSALKFLDEAAKSDKPFYINVNFMKVHQPNLPAPEFEHKSMSKSKYADSVVELDARIGHVLDKLRELGLDKNTLVFYTTDNGAWQDVYPDAGYTPFRGTKGTGPRGRQPCSCDRSLAGKDCARREEPRHHRRPRSHGNVCIRRGHHPASGGPGGGNRSSSTAST